MSLLDSNAGRHTVVAIQGLPGSEPRGKRTPHGDESDLGFLDRELNAHFERKNACFEHGTELRTRAEQRVAEHGRRAEPRRDALLRLT